MQTEVERKPIRQNSYEARILPFVSIKASKQTIEQETGLSGDILTHAIKRVRANYTGKLTPEAQVMMHRENTSAARGGIYVAIEKYLALDLTSKQTQVLLLTHDHLVIAQRRIALAYSREVCRHGLQRPIDELMIEAQRDKFRSWERLLGIAENRIEAYSYVQAQGLPKPPSLQEWTELETELGENPNGEIKVDHRRIRRILTVEKRYAATHERGRKPLWERKLKPAEVDMLEKFLLNRLFVPNSTIEQRYLLNLARGQEQLNKGIVQTDPNIEVKLGERRIDLVRRQVKRNSV